MHFEISREALLTPLRMLASVVERKQIQPILGNALVTVRAGQLILVGTDSHIEIATTTDLEGDLAEGAVTIPVVKWHDICRSLPDNAVLKVREENNGRVSLVAGKSRFSLATLPADQFPNSEESESQLSFSLPRGTLRTLFSRTSFAMAQQDVRFYLNGLLMHVQDDKVTVVATDGHRLAMANEPLSLELPIDSEPLQVIIPRKSVIELTKILDDSEEPLEVAIGGGQIRFSLPKLAFTSKLIDGTYPDYERVIPGDAQNVLTVECAVIKQAFQRVSILANENKGVRMEISAQEFRVSAHNPEQEEAEEEVAAEYQGEELEIGFNVTYLLDALSAVETVKAHLKFTDSNSSCLIEPDGDETAKYVVMPMRL